MKIVKSDTWRIGFGYLDGKIFGEYGWEFYWGKKIIGFWREYDETQDDS